MKNKPTLILIVDSAIKITRVHANNSSF